MALPLLAPAIKALTSSAVKAGAKKAVASTAKKMLTGNEKKSNKKQSDDETERGGLVKRYGLNDTFSAPKTVPVKPPEVTTDTETSKGSVSFSSIKDSVENIEKSTGQLNKLLIKQYGLELKRNKAARREAEKEKQKRREDEVEKDTGSENNLLSKAVEDDPFNIFNFLGNVLLGFSVIKLIELISLVDKSFNNLGRSLYTVFTGLRLGLVGLRAAAKIGLRFLGSAVKLTTRLVTKPFRVVFGTIRKGFKLLGSAIFRAAKSVVGIIDKKGDLDRLGRGRDGKTGGKKGRGGGLKAAGGLRGIDTAARLRGTSTTAGFRGAGRYRLPGQALAGGTFQSQIARRSVQAGTSTVRAGSLAARTKQFLASLQTGTARIALSPSVQRGIFNSAGNIRKGAAVVRTATARIGNTVVSGLGRFAGIGRFAGRFLRRIPIIGPLLVLAANLMDPEVMANGGPERAVYRAAGAAIGGGFVAALVGGATMGFGAILGQIMGEIVGEYLGDLLFIGVKGGGLSAIGEKISEDFTNYILKPAGKAVDWLKGGFERFYEMIPKFKLPTFPSVGLLNLNNILYGPLNSLIKNMTGTGIQDIEFPNPLWFFDPGTAMHAASAFFGTDSVEEGEVSEIEVDKIDLKDPEPTIERTELPEEVQNVINEKSYDSTKDVGSQITKNYGYKTFEEVEFEINGQKYMARKSKTGWKFFKRKMFGFIEDIDTSGGKNQFIIKGFLNVVDPQLTPTTESKPQVEQPTQAEISPSDETLTTQTNIVDLYKGGGNQKDFPTTSGYGMRMHPIHGVMKMHKGIDIAPPGPGYYVGLKVPGVVTRIGNDPRGYGKFVIISSEQTGMSYMFAHMATIDVKMNEEYTGQPIGEMGTTGGSTGIHLHFEVYQGGKDGPEVDPTPYLNLLVMGKKDGQTRTQTTSVKQPTSKPTSSQISSAQISSATETVPQGIDTQTSYEDGSDQVVFVPSPAGQTPQMGGGGETGSSMIGGSTVGLVNSYYKRQLLGFLYKQG